MEGPPSNIGENTGTDLPSIGKVLAEPANLPYYEAAKYTVRRRVRLYL